MIDINSELTRTILVAGLYIILFVSVELWYKVKNPPVEQTRKFVHIFSGLIALSFGYLFNTYTYVLVLCAGFAGLLYLTEKMGLLPSIHNVDRKSKGSLYFPVAVFVVFYIAQQLGRPEFYFLSILVLSVSDTLAALAGKKYGFKLYEVETNTKSIEGSVIFFLSTFVILLVGILLLTDIARFECILGALYIAILVTAFEAVSTDGADNIFIPLGTIYILNKIPTKSPEELIYQILAIFIIYFLVYLIAGKKNKLSSSGIMGLALISYAAFSLRNIFWCLPVLLSIFLINYLNVFLPEYADKKDTYKIVAVFYTVLPPLFWVILSNLNKNNDYEYYLAFILTICTLLAMMWEGRSRETRLNEENISNNSYYYLSPVVRCFLLSLLYALFCLFIYAPFEVAGGFIALFTLTYFADRMFWFFEDHYVSGWQFINLIKLRSIVIFIFSVIIVIVNSMFQILS